MSDDKRVAQNYIPHLGRSCDWHNAEAWQLLVPRLNLIRIALLHTASHNVSLTSPGLLGGLLSLHL